MIPGKMLHKLFDLPDIPENEMALEITLGVTWARTSNYE
jgi:hypothetical protein